jgi:hypothetical protein
MNIALQAQRDQMNAGFEKRMKINELKVEKQKLKTTIEETRESTCAIESIKAHALILSEELTA